MSFEKGRSRLRKKANEEAGKEKEANEEATNEKILV